MALPINIEDLINSRTVESTRKEFKEGWNPEEIIRSICAFANDINELGGGYIFIGIQEQDGTPILPPKGLKQNQTDAIQKKFYELCNRIKPNIFPEIEVVEYQEKLIILIWVITGEERPYKCPSTLGQKASQKIYVRPSSLTIEANEVLERRLRDNSKTRHFDDRINTKASIQDLDLGLILSYLNETKAQLSAIAAGLSMEYLCDKMKIIRGPKESLKPLNVGLLLFSKAPEEHFPGCKTNLLEFTSDDISEYSNQTFVGPVHFQITQILDYFKTNVIKEFTVKREGKAVADKFHNYPYKALREAIVNALYHRNYEVDSPNEIRIYNRTVKDNEIDERRIEIYSYDGPLAPIDDKALVDLNVTARSYRNIKLGDWLKQLGLAETHATGIPIMVQELSDNGSPKPILSTDDDRTYFSVIFKIHPDTPTGSSSNEKTNLNVSLTNQQQKILEKLESEPKLLKELVKEFGESVSDNLNILIEEKLIDIKKAEETNWLFFSLKKEIYFLTKRGRDSLNSSF